VILYPTGGGTGLIGMWKAFAEMGELGWLRTEKLPRLIACQSDGCAPIVTAYDKGERFAEPFPNARTVASGLRVPAAVGDFMILDAVRASRGRAMTGEEGRIVEWMRRAMSLEGVSLCPEAAVCLDCLERLVRDGAVRPEEEVVVFNTGAAQKYLEAVPTLDLPRVDRTRAVDYRAIGRRAGA
jgi:threonine synthase